MWSLWTVTDTKELMNKPGRLDVIDPEAGAGAHSVTEVNFFFKVLSVTPAAPAMAASSAALSDPFRSETRTFGFSPALSAAKPEPLASLRH